MARSPLAEWRDAVRDSDLDRTAKLVGLVLSTYMDGDGAAFPSKMTIAAGASLGNPRHKGSSAVDRAINRLEAEGFLRIERRRGRRGFTYHAEIPPGAAGLAGREIPPREHAKSRPDVAEIPPRGAGESAESAESVSRRRRRTGALEARPDLSYLDTAGAGQ